MLAHAACTPARPPVTIGAPPADTARVIVQPSDSAPWTFAHAAGVHRFEVRSEAIVDAPDARVTDTIRLSAYLTYVVSTADSPGITGTIDSFTVEGMNIPPGHQPAALPIPFELMPDSSGKTYQLVSPDTSTCGSPSGTLLALAREVLITVPPAVRAGTRWTDSAVVTSCRGDIPITLASERRSVIERIRLDEAGVRLIVRRESLTSLHGTGTRRIQSTTVTGTGSGWLEYVLDPSNGRLLGGQGESQLELVFDAASRRMSFRQRVRQSIRRLDGSQP